MRVIRGIIKKNVFHCTKFIDQCFYYGLGILSHNTVLHIKSRIFKKSWRSASFIGEIGV